MKIKFQVDNQKKEIIFFFKNGDMKYLAQELINRFPGKNNEELSNIGSKHLVGPVMNFLQLIEDKTKVPVTTYNTRYVCYQRNMELPQDVRNI